MKITLLDAKTLGADLDLTPLKELGELSIHQTTSPDETLDRIIDSDIVITNKVVISSDMMSQTPRLKLICISATGMNNVDLDEAKRRGIEVKNVAGYSTASVVQHTFALALYLLEKMAYYDKSVKSGEWSRSGLFTDVSHPFGEIANMKWGVIGMGAIGRGVATVASSFGAEVVYYSTSGVNLSQEYTSYPLDKLLAESDIISIHSPLNEQTLNLINSKNLHLIRDGAILLNLGRGGIINEEDLAKEIDRRDIFVGLDVLSTEPLKSNNPLALVEAKERLLITPHIAWTSIEARVKLLDGVVANIRSFQP
jgi:glycerate dehydrogenase